MSRNAGASEAAAAIDKVSDGAVCNVAGLVLAGGLGRRMGGRHKALLELAGQPMIVHVLRRLRPQVGRVIVSANAEMERLASFDGVEAVVRDEVPGHAGPLAGVLSGMTWLREHQPDARWLLSVAVDMPFLPADLCTRLLDAVRHGEGQPVAPVVAAGAGRVQPVVALWPVALEEELRQALKGGRRKMHALLRELEAVTVDFGCESGVPDPFFNVNTPEDLARAAAQWSNVH